MARLREQLSARELPVVLAADESIRKAEDPVRVAELGAAEVVIVKVQPLGGIAAARSVLEACGLPAVVSSALESSVGLAAGAQLAATLPRTQRSRELLGEHPACGLGHGSALRRGCCGARSEPEARRRADTCYANRPGPTATGDAGGGSGTIRLVGEAAAGVLDCSAGVLDRVDEGRRGVRNDILIAGVGDVGGGDDVPRGW